MLKAILIYTILANGAPVEFRASYSTMEVCTRVAHTITSLGHVANCFLKDGLNREGLLQGESQ